MITYNRDLPLIVIHVPKAAGVSSGHIFRDWYGDNFHKHYARESEEKLYMPKS